MARLRYFSSSDIFNFFRFLTIRKPRDLAQSSQVDDQLNKLFKKKIIFLIPLKMKRRCALFARSPPPSNVNSNMAERRRSYAPVSNSASVCERLVSTRLSLHLLLLLFYDYYIFRTLSYVGNVQLVKFPSLCCLDNDYLSLSILLFFPLRLWGLLHRPISVTHSTSQLRSTSRDNFLPPPAPPPQKQRGCTGWRKRKNLDV